MKILGISAYYHDSAAALVEHGVIKAAAQEERFTRIRHDADFPEQSIRYCLQAAKTNLRDVDHIVFYDKPFVKFDRLISTYLSFAPKGLTSFMMSMPVWLSEKLFQKRELEKSLEKIEKAPGLSSKFLFTEHHQSHAASAFFPSPFNEAAVLTMDGVGEWTTTSLAVGKGNDLEILKEIRFPHSIGLLYTAFTYYTGFKVNSGEYKVMGLAPYGVPRFKDLILEKLVDLKEDGSFHLDQSYFGYCTGKYMTNEKFDELFGGPARKSEDKLTQREMDLAASVQAATEEMVLRISRYLAKESGMKNLCLAGGVALNCVANGKIVKEKIFENVWVQPAAGDAGGALGAALAAHYIFKKQPRTPPKPQPGLANDFMFGSYLGPEFTDDEIGERLKSAGARTQLMKRDEMISATAAALESGKAIGWFQGRMEFGPRALGARSILGDPRNPEMQKNLNLKVKFRESFRPFAPSITREEVDQWFDWTSDSPYMLMVAPVAEKIRKSMTAEQEKLFGIEKLNVPRSSIPAVTHVDYSARIQTVHRDTNPVYYSLLNKFKEKTGCPVLINTSFNVRGEPIVCTPEDAFRCFMGTQIDVLVCGNHVLRKEDQDPKLLQDYKDKFELD